MWLFFCCITFSASAPLCTSRLSKGQKSRRIMSTPDAILRQKRNGFCRAMIFGMISPKSSSRKVSSTVMQTNCSQ